MRSNLILMCLRVQGKSSKNAGSQMKRVQAAVKHNTLFGLMTSRLESAAASLSETPD